MFWGGFRLVGMRIDPQVLNTDLEIRSVPKAIAARMGWTFGIDDKVTEEIDAAVGWWPLAKYAPAICLEHPRR